MDSRPILISDIEAPVLLQSVESFGGEDGPIDETNTADFVLPETEFMVELDHRMAILQAEDAVPADRERASAELFAEFYPGVLKISKSILKNEDEAEDSAMQSIANVLLKAHQYLPRKPVEAWINTIARNNAINRYRQMQKSKGVNFLGFETSAEDEFHNTESIMTKTEVDHDQMVESDYADLLQKLLSVNPDFLRPLQLVAEGYHYLEIAEIEGIPLGTVMSRVFRGRRIAKTLLKT